MCALFLIIGLSSLRPLYTIKTFKEEKISNEITKYIKMNVNDLFLKKKGLELMIR